MRGTIEIFSILTSKLVFSDGLGVSIPIDSNLDQTRDYFVVRRYSRTELPEARICSFILNEFLTWHLGSVSHFEAFSDLSSRDFAFLSGEL